MINRLSTEYLQYEQYLLDSLRLIRTVGSPSAATHAARLLMEGNYAPVSIAGAFLFFRCNSSTDERRPEELPFPFPVDAEDHQLFASTALSTAL